MARRNRIWQSDNISFASKFKLHKSLVTSIAVKQDLLNLKKRKEKEPGFSNQMPEESSPHLRLGTKDQWLGAEQDQQVLFFRFNELIILPLFRGPARKNNSNNNTHNTKTKTQQQKTCLCSTRVLFMSLLTHKRLGCICSCTAVVINSWKWLNLCVSLLVDESSNITCTQLSTT